MEAYELVISALFTPLSALILGVPVDFHHDSLVALQAAMVLNTARKDDSNCMDDQG